MSSNSLKQAGADFSSTLYLSSSHDKITQNYNTVQPRFDIIRRLLSVGCYIGNLCITSKNSAKIQSPVGLLLVIESRLHCLQQWHQV